MYEARIHRVLEALEQMGLEQMIVCDPDSIWYLTGYYVEPYERLLALYLQKNGNHKLFLNRLFPVPQCPYEQVWFSDTDHYLEILAQHVGGTRPIGIDKDWPARFLLPLMEYHPQCRCLLASDCVDNARACKDETERDLMRRASAINDMVMERTAAFIREGMTEREIADYIVAQYAAEGCDDVAFHPIVSFGAHGADPHHQPDQTCLKQGDCIVIDTGCRKDRYCSDMTRTFFCGQPDPGKPTKLPSSWSAPAFPCVSWTKPLGTTLPQRAMGNTLPTGWATLSVRRSTKREMSACLPWTRQSLE